MAGALPLADLLCRMHVRLVSGTTTI
jgi:hypothetical protein